MQSTIHVSARRNEIAMFSGFNGTHPALEESDATARRIADLIAPEDGPLVLSNKDQGVFYVPSELKVAPFVGKTLAWAIELGLSTVGKQRSGTHVIAGAWAKLDGDGLTEAQLATVQTLLCRARIAHLIYSTHSHGRADKPGIRCRIVMFFDKALEPVEYQRAVQSLSKWLLGQSLDESEARLCQQAGVWCAHPDRVEQAFCIRRLDGYCVSVDALLAASPKSTVSKRIGLHLVSTARPVEFIATRVDAALKFCAANEYDVWIGCGIWLKAAYGDNAYPIWLAWSQTADESHRADENECERVWGGIAPRINAEAGAGALFGRARDAAVAAVRKAGATGTWNQGGKAALLYLRCYHRKVYAELIEVAA